MKLTFKQFIAERDISVHGMVRQTIGDFLGNDEMNAVGYDLEQEVLDRGKQDNQKIYSTAAGKIVITKYLFNKQVFVRLENPDGKHLMYQR